MILFDIGINIVIFLLGAVVGYRHGLKQVMDLIEEMREIKKEVENEQNKNN
jgi:hypothetical protein